LDDQIKNGEIGWTCGTYGKEEGYMQGVVGGNKKEKVTPKTRPMWDNTKLDFSEREKGLKLYWFGRG
jgi:hypothetical protein